MLLILLVCKHSRARALVGEGFREVATAMLFVRELAVRIEEPALAPAVVR